MDHLDQIKPFFITPWLPGA